MTDTEYDFTQTINTPQLQDEIATAGLAAPDYIDSDGTDVQIFYVSPLSSDDQTTLTGVVAAHVANPAYVPLALQTQITTLQNYLNSANPTIANAARAAIISFIAPHMGIGMLTSINAAVHAATGA